MCRIVIAAGNVNVKKMFDAAIAMATDHNSTHEFNEANGPGTWIHDDGWGLAWIQDGKWQIFKSTDAIYEDSQTESFYNLKSSFVMLHIRKRMGSETAIENTHPFQMSRPDIGNFVFCHNGYAGEDFNYCESFKPKGKTDSERLFYSILTKMKDHDLRCAIPDTLAEVETKTGTNVILSNVDKSFIALKENNFPNYYTMCIARNSDSIMVLSEVVPSVLDGFTLESVNAGEMISVDHRTLEVNRLEKKSCSSKESVNSLNL